MARWRIQLLGDLAIQSTSAPDGGEPASRFRWQKVGSLLARLAWKPGERVSREVLIALLWPDERLEKGRENLRAALASLRRQLEPPDVESGTILVTHGRTHVSLNPEAVETDVILFERAVRQGRYTDAIALYKGLLLPDIYDDWTQGERERLEELANRARRQISDRVAPTITPQIPPSESIPPPPSEVRLPFRMTRFHGRREEMADVTALLRRERLVTITGAGGTGKTRFAIEVAQALASDFTTDCFVPLADLTNSASLAGHIANRMEIETNPRIESLDALANALNQKATPILLALDNFEHLTSQEQGPLFVRDLLEQIPLLTCLVTSRHRLGIQGEREFPLLPLPVPPVDVSPEHLLQYPAVSLFVDRAQSVRPDFQVTPRNAETVARLVEHLEGIPLALELAASWMKSFSASRILEDISRRSILVSRGKQPLPPRQASLRATLDHSLFLLTPEMRRLLLGLSVFRGGCTVDAAAEVCEEANASVLLTQLRERSLLYSEEVAGEIRFRMLEVLRQYVAEQLSDDSLHAIARRHATWYRQLLEAGRLQLTGPEQGKWLDCFEIERTNVIVALNFCLQDEGWDDTEVADENGLRIAVLFGQFWLYRGYFQEARQFLEACLNRGRKCQETEDVGNCLLWLGKFAREMGELHRANECTEKSLAVFRLVNTEAGIASALGHLGRISWRAGNHAMAQKRFEECLERFRAIGNRQEVGGHLINLGAVLMEQEQYDEAIVAYEESLENSRAVGDYRATAMALNNLGNVFGTQGEYEKALTYQQESLRVFQTSGDMLGTRLALANCGRTYISLNRLPDAREVLHKCIALPSPEDEIIDNAHVLEVVARYALSNGDFASALVLLVARSRRWEESGVLEAREYLSQDLVNQTRTSLTGAEYEKAFQEGRSLSWKGTLDKAREILNRPLAMKEAHSSSE